jgi:GTP cyclohydrolase II
MTVNVFAATAPFMTRSYGEFTVFVTDRGSQGGQDVVLAKGEVAAHSKVLCRITSRCMMSTAFDADDCDCAEQIHLALSLVHEQGIGILIYLDQEGRGHGLIRKVHAMGLKALGHDTFSAFEEMGLLPDITDYSRVPNMLSALGVSSIRLLSNNPEKREALEAAGVIVEQVLPCVPANVPKGALRHLEAKKRRGHTINLLGGLSAV